MKRIHVISLLIVCWILALIGTYFCINHYINNKRSYLYSKIINDLDAVFEGQGDGDGIYTDYDGFFFLEYNNPVRKYTKIQIPSDKEEYDNLLSLYEINWNEFNGLLKSSGWRLKRFCLYGNEIVDNEIFPYQIGFKKIKQFYSIEQAVNDAFVFFKTNEKSMFYGRIKDESPYSFMHKIFDCENEYYGLERDTNIHSWNSTDLVDLDASQELAESPNYINDSLKYKHWIINDSRRWPYKIGGMYTDYYKVFIAATQDYGHLMIKEITENVKRDEIKLERWWFSGITVLFLLFIVPLSIMEYKSNKRKAETLRERLLRLCNPQNYMRNYDKEKVDKANCLYQRLLQTKADDKESLMEIQEMAVSELGISFVEKEDLEELKEKVNPMNYMNPYNADKVTLANELYDILCKKDLSYREFVDVTEKSKLL